MLSRRLWYNFFYGLPGDSALENGKEVCLTLSGLCLPATKASFWRQIWRVAGRESGSPELLGSPQTSPEVPRTSPEVFGNFRGSSLTVELNSNSKLPRKFPKLPRKFPELPRKFREFPGGQPLSLGSLTPSPDSQKLSLKFATLKFVCFCSHGITNNIIAANPWWADGINLLKRARTHTHTR